MQPNVPCQLEGSWYSGKVKIIVQDSVFQKSTAYRNAAATVRLAQEDPSEWKPIHVKYSDGGTEHCTLLVKVQLSLIAIFKMLGLDMLIACRAAPGQSWQNPVERVMAILNIGLQNCALETRQQRTWKHFSCASAGHSGRTLQLAEVEGRANDEHRRSHRCRGRFGHAGYHHTLPFHQVGAETLPTTSVSVSGNDLIFPMFLCITRNDYFIIY